MSIFQSFANFVLRRKSYAKNTNHSNEHINVNDLRIVKVYMNHKKDVDEYGNVVGTETVKAYPSFMLVEKKGDYYLTIPAEKGQSQNIISTNSSELYDLVIKKTNKNNRYRKPYHLCKELDGKIITKQQAQDFAKILSDIDCDVTIDIKTQENNLKLACQKFNSMLNTMKNEQEEEICM